jgi:hypothetical protein
MAAGEYSVVALIKILELSPGNEHEGNVLNDARVLRAVSNHKGQQAAACLLTVASCRFCLACLKLCKGIPGQIVSQSLTQLTLPLSGFV